jgi:putative ABC transport system permease protein
MTTRQPGLRLLFWALMIAVTAHSTVTFFIDRIEQALYREGAAALAADLVIRQNQPVPAAWMTQATQHGLQHSQQINFPSVIFARDKPHLVQIKAVDSNYPLRGKLQAQRQPGVNIQQPPAPGQAIADPALLHALGTTPQQAINIPLGARTLKLHGKLIQVPDASLNLFQLAPRLLIHRQDAEASGLLGPASRARYRLLLAGTPTAIDKFRTWLTPQLPPTSELLTLDNSSPELQQTIQHTQRFLSLAALCASLLAGIGILLATRHYVDSLLTQTAILRTLGMTRRQVFLYHSKPLLQIGLSGTSLGLIFGYLLQAGLALWLADWFDQTLPTAGWQPVPQAIIQATLLLSGFALPTLWSVQYMTPHQILRQDQQSAGLTQYTAWIGATLAFCGLLYWQANDLILTLSIIASLGLMTLILLGGAWCILAIPCKSNHLLSGRTALQRNPGLTRIQIVAYGIALTLLLLLTLVRGDILRTWQDSMPTDAPNHFLINIQPDQASLIRKQLATDQITNTGLYPTTRARLSAINDQPVEPTSYQTPRARQLASREYNLGFSDQLQTDNQLTSGTWWQPGTPALSIEQELANTLQLQVGDQLTFDVAGQTLQARIANIRRVTWDSFNINFFVQASAALQTHIPHAFITSLHIPADNPDFLRQLATQFPTVSAINIQPLLDKVSDIIYRGSLAIEGIFLFTLAAAGLISLAALRISRAQRQRDIALLRTLGATRQQLRRYILSEFALLGGLSGLLAAALANSLGNLLGYQFFALTIGFRPEIWLLGGAIGLVGVSLLGWQASRPILRQPPLARLSMS